MGDEERFRLALEIIDDGLVSGDPVVRTLAAIGAMMPRRTPWDPEHNEGQRTMSEEMTEWLAGWVSNERSGGREAPPL